jgi:hypothetical protein
MSDSDSPLLREREVVWTSLFIMRVAITGWSLFFEVCLARPTH